MPQRPDVLDVLTEDHREVERLFAAYEGSTDAGQRRELVDHMIIDLVRHSVAAEAYLYPAVRRELADGERIADARLGELAAAEETMSALDGVDAGSEEFARHAALLMMQVHEHVAEEENAVFPQVRSALSAEERARLGARVERAERLAPTYPHPHTPGQPPPGRLLAPLVGVVDRLRDRISGRRRTR